MNKRERGTKQAAETAVKNAFELALHVDKTGAMQVKKFTMGAQALFPTLLQEKELRLFEEKIDAEPKTTVAALYAELKKVKGNPWPPQAFIDTLSEALGRGLMQRASGSGPLVSLAADGTVELTVKSIGNMPDPEPEPIPGRKLSPRVTLSPAEFQNLADDVSTLSKSPAGCDVQFEVAVSLKTKAGMDLTQANVVLAKIKKGWKL